MNLIQLPPDCFCEWWWVLLHPLPMQCVQYFQIVRQPNQKNLLWFEYFFLSTSLQGWQQGLPKLAGWRWFYSCFFLNKSDLLLHTLNQIKAIYAKSQEKAVFSALLSDFTKYRNSEDLCRFMLKKLHRLTSMIANHRVQFQIWDESDVSTHRTTHKASPYMLPWNRRGYAPYVWMIRHQWRGFNQKGNLMN